MNMNEYKYNSDDKELEGWNQVFTSRFGDGSGDSEADYLSTLKLIVRLKPRATVLEIGSGLGRIVELLRDDAASVVGLEPDFERFQSCLKNYDDTKKVRIFRCSSDDFRRKNPESCFDIVVVSMVVQHVPTDICSRIFSDVNKLLADDGVAIIATTHFPEERFTYQFDSTPRSAEEFDAYASDTSRQEFGIPVRQFSRRSLMSALELANLHPIYWRQFSYVRPDKLEWWSKEMKIPSDSLRDFAASQFVIVCRE